MYRLPLWSSAVPHSRRARGRAVGGGAENTTRSSSSHSTSTSSSPGTSTTDPGRYVSAVASAGHEVQPPSGAERQLGALALEHDQRIQVTEAHAGADLHGKVGIDLVPGDAVAAELDGPGRALAAVGPEPGEVVLLGNLLEPPEDVRPARPGPVPADEAGVHRALPRVDAAPDAVGGLGRQGSRQGCRENEGAAEERPAVRLRMHR